MVQMIKFIIFSWTGPTTKDGHIHVIFNLWHIHNACDLYSEGEETQLLYSQSIQVWDQAYCPPQEW